MRRGNDDEPAPHHIVSRWLQTRRMCVDEDNDKAGTDGGERSGSGEAPFLETREGGEELRMRMRADAPSAIMVSRESRGSVTVAAKLECCCPNGCPGRVASTPRNDPPPGSSIFEERKKNGDTGLLALALDSGAQVGPAAVASAAKQSPP
ncbi:hypothetical protein FDECE_6672 [Fusarium decemcellulare]|nr:hypothetical protein FDECE_6672 [Fusarium decemcellulare]